MSMTFSYSSTWGCQFLLVRAKGDNKANAMGFGMFSEAFYDEADNRRGCLPYLTTFQEQYVSDPAFGAGRTFSVMTVLLLTSATGLLLVTLCFVRPGRLVVWKMIRMLLVGSAFTQLFAFSVFASDFCNHFDDLETECHAGPAAALASVNVFWIVFLILVSVMVPPPLNPVFRLWNSSSGSGSVAETEGVNLSGRDERRKTNGVLGRPIEDKMEVQAADTFDMLQAPSTRDEDDEDKHQRQHSNAGSPQSVASTAKDFFWSPVSHQPRNPSFPMDEDGAETDELSCVATTAVKAPRPQSSPLFSPSSPADSCSAFGNTSAFGNSTIHTMDDDAASVSYIQDDSVIYETFLLSQGKKMVQTVTHSDGSQSVTTTIEAPDESIEV
jgi:hypothetical protein